MTTVWRDGRGPKRGSCPECHRGRMTLVWRDKISAEYFCDHCGLVLKHGGYRSTAKQSTEHTELESIVVAVFEELEKRKVPSIALQPFVRTVDAIWRSLYDHPLDSLTLEFLDHCGLEVYLDKVYKKSKR